LSSAPCSGGIEHSGLRNSSWNIALAQRRNSGAAHVLGAMSISSLSQSSSSEVDGFFFRPGTRASRRTSQRFGTSSRFMPGKCTSTICVIVSASGKRM
jgi:hypothetical protein